MMMCATMAGMRIADPTLHLVFGAVLMGCASEAPPPPAAPAEPLAVPASPSEPSSNGKGDDDGLRQLVTARPFVRMVDCGHDDEVAELACGYSVAGEPRPIATDRRLRLFLTEPPGLVLAAVDWEPDRALGEEAAVIASCAYEERGSLRDVHLGAAPGITGYRYFGALSVGIATACDFAPHAIAETLRAAHVLVAHAHANRAPPGVTRSRSEAAERILEVSDELARGSFPFDAAVAKYSDESGAAQRGGFLGTFRPETMAPEFSLVVLGTRLGAQSPAFESSFGFHILERR
jgi:hypothetical protein